VFSIGLDVQFELDSFGISGTLPAPLHFDANFTYTATLTQPDPNPSPPNRVTLVVKHQVGQLDFGIGAYAQITLAHAFNLQGNVGPFTIGHILLNSDSVKHSLTGSRDTPSATAWEVVFG
jgi:hypothetical protein